MLANRPRSGKAWSPGEKRRIPVNSVHIFMYIRILPQLPRFTLISLKYRCHVRIFPI